MSRAQTGAKNARQHTIVLANIKSVPRMPTDDVDSDIATLFKLAEAKCADAVFGAEIAFGDYRRSWRKHAEAADYRSHGAKRECPIAVKAAHVHAVVRLLSRGIAKVTPNRYATVVKDRGHKVAYIATHTVSRWQDYARADSTHGIRRRLANREIRKITRRVTRLHEHSWTVVVGGDLNALTAVEWHPGQVQVLPVTGSNLARMMQLAVIPAPGVTVTPVSHGNHHAGLHTDHPFRWATFDLKEKR